MVELQGAQMYRSGSYGMEYRKDGALVSVFLEVLGRAQGNVKFGHLHIGSEIKSFRCDSATIVPKGSEQEQMLMRDIEELLIEGPTNDRRQSMASMKKLRDLLPTRMG